MVDLDLRGALIYVHLTGVIIFLIAHGTSASVGFRLRREREPVKVSALLEASGSTLGVMGIGWMLVLISGIVLGVQYWLNGGVRLGWFYASIVVFMAVTFSMTPLTRGYLKARGALGVKPGMVSPKAWQKIQAKGYTRDKLGEYLNETNPMALASIGFGGVLVLMFLMMFKPF